MKIKNQTILGGNQQFVGLDPLRVLNDYHMDFVKRKFPNITDWRGPLWHCKKEISEALESGEKKEFADALLTLMSSYRLRFPKDDLPIDLVVAAWSKLSECEDREWGPVNEQGFQEHIK